MGSYRREWRKRRNISAATNKTSEGWPQKGAKGAKIKIILRVRAPGLQKEIPM
jgi:hypothetical protein